MNSYMLECTTICRPKSVPITLHHKHINEMLIWEFASENLCLLASAGPPADLESTISQRRYITRITLRQAWISKYLGG